jgi:hypothetical protein
MKNLYNTFYLTPPSPHEDTISAILCRLVHFLSPNIANIINLVEEKLCKLNLISGRGSRGVCLLRLENCNFMCYNFRR